VNIRKAAEDARDAGMIRANVRIPDLLAVLDERDHWHQAYREEREENRRLTRQLMDPR
jgi:hypothetical protein